jgi:hypothetical protein
MSNCWVCKYNTVREEQRFFCAQKKRFRFNNAYKCKTFIHETKEDVELKRKLGGIV